MKIEKKCSDKIIVTLKQRRNGSNFLSSCQRSNNWKKGKRFKGENRQRKPVKGLFTAIKNV